MILQVKPGRAVYKQASCPKELGAQWARTHPQEGLLIQERIS